MKRMGVRAFSNKTEKTIDFGFQDVKYEEKEEKVKEIFHNVADNYDLMNDLTSMGVHRLWKQYFVDSIGPIRPRSVIDGNEIHEVPMKVLDVAGGTGDISFKIYEKAKSQSFGSVPVDITVSDINSSMLGVGKERAEKLGYNLRFLEANAEKFETEKDDTYDLYTIAFGIRNVSDRMAALKEAHRMLRRGGRFMCLEFSEVTVPFLREFYDFYSFNAIPLIGKLVTNDSESYQYLVESIRKFPKQKEFAAMITEAGFKHVTYTNLTGGIVCIHSGYKL